MAGLIGRAVTAQIATGTAAKTLLQLVAASSHRVVVKEWHISFEGTTATNAPIQVRVLRQSTAGTMSSLTLVKDNDSDDETLQTTAQHTSTSEPTAGDVLFSQLVHPQGGRFSVQGNEVFTIKGGGRLGFEVTASVDVDAVVCVKFEE